MPLHCAFYIFPLFSLLPRVLTKVKQDQILSVLLIAPVWTTQIWYPTLLSLLVERPILLTMWNCLLTLPNNGAVHLLRHQLQLAAWPISGKACKIKAFLKGLPNSSSCRGQVVPKNSTLSHGMSGVAGVLGSKQIFFLLL